MDGWKKALLIFLSIVVSLITLKLGYLAIGVFIIVVLIAYFFNNPLIAFYLIFLTRPIIDMFWEVKFKLGFSPLYVVGALVPILIIIYLVTHKKNIFGVKSISLILIFFLSALITFVLNILRFPEEMFGSTVILAKTVSAFSMMFVAPFLFTDKVKINRLLDIIFFSAISAYLSTAGAYLMGYRGIMTAGEHSNFYLTSNGLLRISGVYEGTFNLAYFSLFVIMIAIFRRKDYTKTFFRIVLLSIYILVALFFLYKTYVRTAWGIVVLTFFLYFLFKKKYHMILFLFAGLILLYLTVPTISYRMWNVIAVIKGDVSFRTFGDGRGLLWEMHWNQFKMLPLLSKLFGARHVGNPENQILFLLEYFGIVGCLIYHLVMFYFVYVLYRGYKAFLKIGNQYYSELILFALILHIDFFTFAGIGAQQFMMINSQWIVYSIVAIALLYSEKILKGEVELNGELLSKPV